MRLSLTKVVLIIEDDAHIGGLVAQVLREAGYAPEIVRDVHAARAAGAARHPAGGADRRSDGGGLFGPGAPGRRAGADVSGHAGGVDDRRAAQAPRRARRDPRRIIEKPFELEALLDSVGAMVGRARGMKIFAGIAAFAAAGAAQRDARWRWPSATSTASTSGTRR